jgi:hypothetical protein
LIGNKDTVTIFYSFIFYYTPVVDGMYYGIASGELAGGWAGIWAGGV